MIKKQDIITSIAYKVPEEFTMREVSEAYNELFSDTSKAAKIVAQDLVQYTAFGSEGFNQDQPTQAFTSGLRMVLQHIVNNLNRESFMDEISENVDDIVNTTND